MILQIHLGHEEFFWCGSVLKVQSLLAGLASPLIGYLDPSSVRKNSYFIIFFLRDLVFSESNWPSRL